MEERVVISLRGVIFETFERTLTRFPHTLLGNPAMRARFFDPVRREFCFDRSQHIFDAILFYYQSSGILSRPSNVKEDEFEEELRYFGIYDGIAALKATPSELKPINEDCIQRRIWQLLENPSSSYTSKIIAHVSFLVIVMSSVTFCIETVSVNTSYDHNAFGRLMPGSIWFILEWIYVSWFILEYFGRIIGAPIKRNFLTSTSGVIDFISIGSHFVLIALSHDNFNSLTSPFIRLFRTLQMIRILKLSRHFKSMLLLARSLHYCGNQICSLLLFLIINCLCCGTLLYYSEKDDNPECFRSIFDSLWYCIVSMTTVGYGDVVPITTLGKIMGFVSIILGVLTLFYIFIPVYLLYFSVLYEVSVLQGDNTAEAPAQIAVETNEETARLLTNVRTPNDEERANIPANSLPFQYHPTNANNEERIVSSSSVISPSSQSLGGHSTSNSNENTPRAYQTQMISQLFQSNASNPTRRQSICQAPQPTSRAATRRLSVSQQNYFSTGAFSEESIIRKVKVDYTRKISLCTEPFSYVSGDRSTLTTSPCAPFYGQKAGFLSEPSSSQDSITSNQTVFQDLRKRRKLAIVPGNLANSFHKCEESEKHHRVRRFSEHQKPPTPILSESLQKYNSFDHWTHSPVRSPKLPPVADHEEEQEPNTGLFIPTFPHSSDGSKKQQPDKDSC